ncbi:MAG: hypothetical protein JXR68_14190 [Bacteroidales bacterium]|nr:hypothetical protein [Bacteroidales bacterium]
MNISTNNFFDRLHFAEHWEISDPLFKTVIAKKTDFESVEDALNEIKTKFAGQEIEIKAGSLDKNGNFNTQAIKIKFVIPQKEQEQNITIVGQNKPPQPAQNLTYNLNGVQTPINQNNFMESLKGIEKSISSNLEAKFLKQSYELEYFWKFKDLEDRENRIKGIERDLAQKYKDYEDKLNGILPQAKDFLSKILNGVFFGFAENPKQKPLNNTPEDKNEKKNIEFKIKGKEETKEIEDKKEFAKRLFEELSEEEKDEIFNEYFEEEEKELEEKKETIIK